MLSEESKQKLLCLADWIEKKVPVHQFNMRHWSQSQTDQPIEAKVDGEGQVEATCGTTCCIAGWAVLGAGHTMIGDGTTYDENKKYLGEARDVAERLLGLSREESNRLFLPTEWPGGYQFNVFPNTPKGAADRIRHFVRTGV